MVPYIPDTNKPELILNKVKNNNNLKCTNKTTKADMGGIEPKTLWLSGQRFNQYPIMHMGNASRFQQIKQSIF